MKLCGRRIHIAGSAARDADEAKLIYAHSLVTGLTNSFAAEGATFVIPFGKEPRLKDRTEGPSIIFDWSVVEAVWIALKQGRVRPSGPNGRLIATISTSRTDEHIPEARRTIYDDLRSAGAIEMKFLEPGWTAGALQRQGLAQFGEVLIALSGGQGVEHLAIEYSTKGKPVIPLDLELGASSHDGSGGAARLFGRALSDHKLFFKVTNGHAAIDLLDRTRTRDGTVSIATVTAAVTSLLHALRPPNVFYVRMLNSKPLDYPAVENFFRTTVDTLVQELGYEGLEVGLGENEFAWMNQAIFDSLHHSSVVVVDITGLRSNCFVELEYALGNEQKVIFTAKEGTSFPFDVFALEAFLWKDDEDPQVQLSRFRTHWERNINMPKLVRPNQAK